MRRLLAGWIAVALVVGVVVAVGHRDADDDVAHHLPEVLPLGLHLTAARVAQPGSTLANPLAYRRVLLRRPGDRVFADYVPAPADPEARGAAKRRIQGRPQAFGDGTALVTAADDGPTRVWWTTSRRSGSLSSPTVEADELLAMARRFARTGFAPPPGWKGLAYFDADSAVEALEYADPDGRTALHVDVHLDRKVVRIPPGDGQPPYAQRQLGRAVVTAVAVSADGGLTTADLRAVVDSVRRVDGAAWRAALEGTDVDGRALRWTSLASGRASTNAGWSLAVEDRDGERCLALLVVERALAPDAACGVANWRSDPVLAVPTDRSGPLTVTANGRPLRALAEARFDGRRVLVVELPADLWGQVIDPVAVVSRR